MFNRVTDAGAMGREPVKGGNVSGAAEPGVSSTNGQTQLVGVMGWPVAHSLSPAMHNAALQALGLNWHYVPLAVRPDQVPAAVDGLAVLGFRGFNVTVPHKQVVMSLVDTVSGDAAAVGAVNTVVIERDSNGETTLTGHNTDVRGFITSLRAGGLEPGDGGKAVVVGAGGAARAVVYGLLQAGMDSVVVLNRTVSRAEALISDLDCAGQDPGSLTAGPLAPRVLKAETEDAVLLVNATTVGMWPEVADTIWTDSVAFPGHLTVYDLVYNPLETRLLCRACKAGARTIDGLGMLAWQGALALSYWLDVPLAVSATAAEMRRVCEAALSARRKV